jgi:hypothetical protein
VSLDELRRLGSSRKSATARRGIGGYIVQAPTVRCRDAAATGIVLLPLQLALSFAVSPKHTTTHAATHAAQRGYPALPPAADLPAFCVPDVSPLILGRLIRLYKDVLWRSFNHRGGCWARRHKWRQLYGASADTIRRWLVLLEQCGWIRRVVSGPNRLIIPLVSPHQVAAVLPQYRRRFTGLFKRLPRELLSGFGDPAPLSLVREIHNNKGAAAPTSSTPARPLPLLPPLSPEARAVVVAAIAAGVAASAAEPLVREAGAPAVQDAIEALRYYRDRGREIVSPGGFVHDFALHVARGLWSLPARLIERRERAERKAERERAARQRLVRAQPPASAMASASAASAAAPPEPPAAPPALPALPSDAARLTLLPEVEVRELERRAREILRSQGEASKMMESRIRTWQGGAGAILRREMVRLLLDNLDNVPVSAGQDGPGPEQ